MALDVQIKRIYDQPNGGDAYRVLVDHVPARSDEFRARHRAELAEQVDELLAHASDGRPTIVCAARDQQHNNAVVLAEVLRDG